MLKIEGLKKNYGAFALDCSLEIRPGCVTGLIGQNGAGKSLGKGRSSSWASSCRIPASVGT